MSNRKIEIDRTWGEVGMGSLKREDWLFEISYISDGARVDRSYHDEINAWASQRIAAFLETGKTSADYEVEDEEPTARKLRLFLEADARDF